MGNLSYAPCLRPGCRSPQGHPNCRCYSDVSTESMTAAGYQRPGSTLGLKRRTNPDTGKSWYAGPGNGVTWAGGSQSPSAAQSTGRRLAGKFIQVGKWAASTLGKVGSTYFADGGEVGNLIGDHHHEDCPHYMHGDDVDVHNEILQNPDLATDHSVVAHGLLHLLTKSGRSKSEDPSRVMTDHLDSIKKGRKALESHSNNVFEMKKEHRIDPEPKQAEALKSHLHQLRMNPNDMLDIGGTLGGTMPEHSAAISAKAATAQNYLESIKPKPQQLNPMSPVIPPTRMEDARYSRQVQVSENPMLAFQGIKDGRLSASDLKTVQAIYPKLFEEMKNKATAAIIDSKSKGETISYKHRIGLGLLLGQPLDYSQSPQAALAIMQANMGAQQGDQPNAKPHGGTTEAALDQINKVDSLSETPIESTQAALKHT